jgi:fructose-bisphosphate aldolase, class II
VPLTTTRTLVDQAVAGGEVLLAFNVILLEHAEAVVTGAERSGAPVLLQVSENAVGYHGGRLRPLAAACLAVADQASVPVALHLDHVTDPQLVAQAAACGFGSVMVDASALPYEENVAATARQAAQLHAQGLWVEAELGEVGGKDGAHAPGVRTDPRQAAAFVAATGVDGLAVAVGSSHAMTDRAARLDHDLIARLHAAAGVPLVLHGSSGVPEHELRRAATAGITKVNVGTLLNVALTGQVRRVLDEQPALVDPRRYLAPGRAAMADAVAATLQAVAAPATT